MRKYFRVHFLQKFLSVGLNNLPKCGCTTNRDMMWAVVGAASGVHIECSVGVNKSESRLAHSMHTLRSTRASLAKPSPRLLSIMPSKCLTSRVRHTRDLLHSWCKPGRLMWQWQGCMFLHKTRMGTSCTAPKEGKRKKGTLATTAGNRNTHILLSSFSH